MNLERRGLRYPILLTTGLTGEPFQMPYALLGVQRTNGGGGDGVGDDDDNNNDDDEAKAIRVHFLVWVFFSLHI